MTSVDQLLASARGDLVLSLGHERTALDSARKVLGGAVDPLLVDRAVSDGGLAHGMLSRARTSLLELQGPAGDAVEGALDAASKTDIGKARGLTESAMARVVDATTNIRLDRTRAGVGALNEADRMTSEALALLDGVIGKRPPWSPPPPPVKPPVPVPPGTTPGGWSGWKVAAVIAGGAALIGAALWLKHRLDDDEQPTPKPPQGPPQQPPVQQRPVPVPYPVPVYVPYPVYVPAPAPCPMPGPGQGPAPVPQPAPGQWPVPPPTQTPAPPQSPVQSPAVALALEHFG